MLKKIFITLVLIFSFVLFCSYTFATNTTLVNNAGNAMRDTKDAIGNAIHEGVNNTGNAMHNAADNAGNAVHNATNNAGTALHNATNNTGTTVNRTATGTTNYNAARTATPAGGIMNNNMWTWIVVGVIALAIVGLVWYYSVQASINRE